MAGALAGLRIVELAGIGPAPFACMMLADHGAEVIRIERPGAAPGGLAREYDVLARSRRIVELDLKQPEAVEVVRDLARAADGLVEGYRPGVMERLGLGPEQLLADNPRLVYGRMTGWGQDGPWAQAAGHDIDYIALSGVLHGVGRAGEPPVPPLNLVGDFGGGGMLLAFGMVSAMLSARATGVGQIVDCAMTDGSALLMSLIWGLKAQGLWRDGRETNLLDGGAPFYASYECADGRFVAVGAIEPAFYAALLKGLGENPDLLARQRDPTSWPEVKARLAARFGTRTRDEWVALFEERDACVAPVLSMAEAAEHPLNRARGTFVEAGGVIQPAPAPRCSATPPRPPEMAGSSETAAVLTELGYAPARIADLRGRGVTG